MAVPQTATWVSEDNACELKGSAGRWRRVSTASAGDMR